MLEDRIRAEREKKDILLMTHLVLGYPSFEDNRKVIAHMVEAGVELIELQIPFSEPMSDGPVILKANETGERIPLTMAETDPQKGTITVIYQVVGKSTALFKTSATPLAALKFFWALSSFSTILKLIHQLNNTRLAS